MKDTETFKAFRLTAPQEGRVAEKKLSPGHQGRSEGGKGEQRRLRGEAEVRGWGEQSIAGGGGAQRPSVKGQREEEECGSGHVDGGDRSRRTVGRGLGQKPDHSGFKVKRRLETTNAHSSPSRPSQRRGNKGGSWRWRGRWRGRVQAVRSG